MNLKVLADKIKGFDTFPQTTGRMVLREEGQVIAVCALGAAAWACGYHDQDGEDALTILTDCIGIDLMSDTTRHPKTGREMTIYDAVVNLNDSELWTFDEIAEWLETAEVIEYE